jgi:hypothetical protein
MLGRSFCCATPAAAAATTPIHPSLSFGPSLLFLLFSIIAYFRMPPHRIDQVLSHFSTRKKIIDQTEKLDWVWGFFFGLSVQG